jgi:hypothetical protein
MSKKERQDERWQRIENMFNEQDLRKSLYSLGLMLYNILEILDEDERSCLTCSFMDAEACPSCDIKKLENWKQKEPTNDPQTTT